MYGGGVLLLVFVMHIVSCYPIYLLAKKADYEYAFFAFIPFLNFVLMLNVAGISGWYVFLMLVPLVNIIFSLVVSYKFYDSYENGLIVFWISVVVGFMAIFIPFMILGVTIAVWWLALSENPFIGEVWNSNQHY